MGFKCLALNANNLVKKKFDSPLKFILGFLRIFYIFSYKPKYWHPITYACEKSPLSHELS